MGLDGSSPVNLSRHPAEDTEPAWAIGGAFIVFVSDRDGDADLYRMEMWAGAVTQLTDAPGADHSPAVAADGRIAFVSHRDGNAEIYLMSAAGGTPTRLTNDAGRDVDPAWSADGTAIFFASNRGGNYDIYSMDTSGGNVELISDGEGDNRWPSLCSGECLEPDEIVFSSNRNNNWDIYSMYSDGSELGRWTDHHAVDDAPSWSADGSYIVFRTNRDDGIFQVWESYYLGDFSGRLTALSQGGSAPDWER